MGRRRIVPSRMVRLGCCCPCPGTRRGVIWVSGTGFCGDSKRAAPGGRSRLVWTRALASLALAGPLVFTSLPAAAAGTTLDVGAGCASLAAAIHAADAGAGSESGPGYLWDDEKSGKLRWTLTLLPSLGRRGWRQVAVVWVRSGQCRDGGAAAVPEWGLPAIGGRPGAFRDQSVRADRTRLTETTPPSRPAIQNVRASQSSTPSDPSPGGCCTGARMASIARPWGRGPTLT